MKFLPTAVLLFACFVVNQPVLASELTAAEQLTLQLKPMQSLKASFEQTIKDVDDVVLQHAKGHLTVKRPRQFYWRTDEPYQHLIVTDGKALWLHDIDLEQINKQAFNADLDKAPALLLSGETSAINQQYTVELDSFVVNSSSYRLTPRNPEALFTELTIVFSNGLLDSMQLRDGFDQNTFIKFTDVELNPEVSDELFNFTPPEGIDVVVDES